MITNQKPRNRFVDPAVFPLFRGLRLGIRTAYALTSGIYVASAFILLISMFAFGLLFESLANSFMLVGVSSVMAVFFGISSWKLRNAAQSLDCVRPLNNEFASQLPVEDTLLRGTNNPTSHSSDSLLRIPATHLEPPDELVRSCSQI